MNIDAYAPRWRRILAFIVDGIFIGLFEKLIRFMYPSKQLINNPITLIEKRTNVELSVFNLNIELLISLVPLLITAYLVSKYSISPGKWLLKIMIKKEDGKNLTFIQALFRELGKIISALPLLLGFLWFFIDKKRQTWHDKFVKAIVISKN